MSRSLSQQLLSALLSFEAKLSANFTTEKTNSKLRARLRRFPFWAEGHLEYARLAFTAGDFSAAAAGCQAALLLGIAAAHKNAAEDLLMRCRQMNQS